ncbi:MAG: Fis family transcriptional regulator [Thiotrichaceae bacterium]|nr:Fis family transcriptional regulator [Thiotrichaceae bacterium]
MSVPNPQSSANLLGNLVHEKTINYLEQYHTTQLPTDIYRRIIEEIEQTLFTSTMKYTFGNQSKAALYLGINRATLRTKLKRHDLL